MKSIKFLAAGVLAAATLTSSFAATVDIRVTGSTAFRKAFYNAVTHTLTGVKVAAANVNKTTVGMDTTTDWSGATRAVITGTLGSDTIIVHAAFAGSLGGLQVVTSSTPINLPGATFDKAHTWLTAADAALATSAPSGNGTLTGFYELAGTAAPATLGAADLALSNFDAAANANASMSDSAQGSTPYINPALSEENSVAGGVGVVNFAWIKGMPAIGYESNCAGLTSVTALQMQLLLSAGELPLSFFTGNSADAGIDVVLVGRNNDSGTRLAAEAEAGYGFGLNTENQYQPTFASSKVSGVTNVGDAGYGSGGSVATACATVQASGAVDDAGKPFIFVAYVGGGDIKTVATASAANILKDNGISGYDTGTFAPINIISGQYSFWTYEHLYYRSGQSSNFTTALNAITTDLRTNRAGQAGIVLSTMTVNRGVEGGVISPN